MKKWLPFLLSVCLLFCVSPRPVYADEVYVSASAAVLLDANSGRVLYAKNPDERRSMASTTKIMTALLALESEQREQVVEITWEMASVEGSSMYLKPGEKVTLETLVYGMLLESGNDAAMAVALTLGGTVEGFAEMMNQKAAALGMTNTHFVTPSGLDDEEHYTTALDLAKLGAAAMQNHYFAEIASKSAAKVDYVDPPTVRTLYNHNRLLKELPGCNGVKTGFTKKSGRCLVSSCERDGVSLIAVTLNAPNDWRDHKAMMEYGFSVMQTLPLSQSGLSISVPVVGGTASSVEIAAGSPIEISLPKGEESNLQMRIETPRFLYAPVLEGQYVGRVYYSLGGRELGEIPLTAASDVARQEHEPTLWEKITGFFRKLFGQGEAEA